MNATQDFESFESVLTPLTHPYQEAPFFHHDSRCIIIFFNNIVHRGGNDPFAFPPVVETGPALKVLTGYFCDPCIKNQRWATL